LDDRGRRLAGELAAWRLLWRFFSFACSIAPCTSASASALIGFTVSGVPGKCRPVNAKYCAWQ
jgi:hypothetical protein